MKIIMETDRLYLRQLEMNDLDELVTILADPESMKYYPQPFSREKVQQWIEWNLDNYRQYQHGLWAVILKDGALFLGDCGITLQEIDGERLPELGYHIKKQYWNQGYATEAAKACMKYAFEELKLQRLYTYTKVDNLPSRKVAEKNGMRFVKEFKKTFMGVTMTEVLYCIDHLPAAPAKGDSRSNHE